MCLGTGFPQLETVEQSWRQSTSDYTSPYFLCGDCNGTGVNLDVRQDFNVQEIIGSRLTHLWQSVLPKRTTRCRPPDEDIKPFYDEKCEEETRRLSSIRKVASVFSIQVPFQDRKACTSGHTIQDCHDPQMEGRFPQNAYFGDNLRDAGGSRYHFCRKNCCVTPFANGLLRACTEVEARGKEECEKRVMVLTYR